MPIVVIAVGAAVLGFAGGMFTGNSLESLAKLIMILFIAYILITKGMQ